MSLLTTMKFTLLSETGKMRFLQQKLTQAMQHFATTAFTGYGQIIAMHSATSCSTLPGGWMEKTVTQGQCSSLLHPFFTLPTQSILWFCKVHLSSSCLQLHKDSHNFYKYSQPVAGLEHVFRRWPKSYFVPELKQSFSRNRSTNRCYFLGGEDPTIATRDQLPWCAWPYWVQKIQYIQTNRFKMLQ